MAILDTRGIGGITLLKRTFKEFSKDDMSTYASALAYRALFSLFPFLLFLMALLGFLQLPEFFAWLREQATLVLPPVALEQVNPVIDQLQQKKSGLMSVGIMVALWTASVGVRALMNAMNRAYGVEEGRPAWKLMLLSLLYTVGIAVTLLTVAGLMVLGPQIMEWLGRPGRAAGNRGGALVLAALAGGDLPDDADGRAALLRHAGCGAGVSLHHARFGAGGGRVDRRVGGFRPVCAELRQLRRYLRRDRRHHRVAAVLLHILRGAAARCGA